jgi:integrase
VATRRVPKRAYVTLCADEVPTLLSYVNEEWRNLFAAALYTGLRKGELCGLLKTDVDLPNRTLTVARSYDRHTTKGGHVDAIPIAEALVPYLENAIARSPSA